MNGMKFAMLIVLSGLLQFTSYSQAADTPPLTEPRQDKEMGTGNWGSPELDRSVDGMRIQVWIIEDATHSRPSGGMASLSGNTTGELSAATMNHTHKIRVTVADEKMAEKVDDQIKVSVDCTLPSGTTSNTSLTRTATGYEGSLTLEKQGKHKFTIVVTSSDAKKRNAEFEYTV